MNGIVKPIKVAWISGCKSRTPNEIHRTPLLHVAEDKIFIAVTWQGHTRAKYSCAYLRHRGLQKSFFLFQRSRLNFRKMMTRAARKRAQLEEWKLNRKKKQAVATRQKQTRYKQRGNRQQKQVKQRTHKQIGAENVKPSVDKNSKLLVPTQSQTKTATYRSSFGLRRSRYYIDPIFYPNQGFKLPKTHKNHVMALIFAYDFCLSIRLIPCAALVAVQLARM